MKIPFEPNEAIVGAVGKYPWTQMHEIGDYFDIPPGNPKQAGGIRNAVYNQGKRQGDHYVVRTLPDGTKRVMLFHIEE